MTTCEDIFDGHNLGNATGIYCIWLRDAAEYPTMVRIAPTTRIIRDKMSAVQAEQSALRYP